MIAKRRKGVAIVHTNKGILVVAGESKKYYLPGGGAEKHESRRKAAVRELYEETGLKTKKMTYLFRYVGHKWRSHDGRFVRNHTEVFLVESKGVPKPRSEIKHIAFWRTGSKLSITNGTRKVIKRYLSNFSS